MRTSHPSGAESRCVLSECRAGSVIRLKAMSGGLKIRMRLASMGLMPGTRLTVLQSTGQGSCILAVGGTRVAIGRGMARRLEVVDA